MTHHQGSAPSRWSLRQVRLSAFLWVHFVAAAVASSNKKASFDVRAQIKSGWPQTPAAAQSLEWLRDVDASEVRAFLRQLGSGESLVAGSEIAAAESRLRSSSARTFHELLVRNSYYSPRIEALRTLERQDRQSHGALCTPGDAWALLWQSGEDAPFAACNAAALRTRLAAGGMASKPKPSGQPLGFIPSSLDILLRQGPTQYVAVVYGAISTEGLLSLTPLLQEVDALGDSPSWRVVLRHADGPPSSVGGVIADSLTGWGFELAIKSSEYKTHADEQKKDEGSDGESKKSVAEAEGGEQQLDGELELDGLKFDVLLKRSPVLRPGIWALKEQLESERDTDKLLKAWEINDIGLQASHKIQTSQAPLLALMKLSQNFPAHVVGLAKTAVPQELHDAASVLRNTIREGAEVFSINGRVVRPDHSDLSLFPMMKTLQPFFVGVERLVRTGLSEALACEFLTESRGIKLPERLDWRSPLLPPPSYLVTKDKKTARWGTSLQHLMYAFGGGLVPMRLPLYQVVFAFDAADLADLKAAQNVLDNTPLPVAVHLVMVSRSKGAKSLAWDDEALGSRPGWLQKEGSGTSGSIGAGATVTRAGSVLCESYGWLLNKKPARARAYLKALVEKSSAFSGRWPDTEQGMSALKALWVESLPSENPPDVETTWSAILEAASGNGQRGSATANATQYASGLGVPIPSMLVNGKLLLKAAYSGQHSILPTIAYEQQVFQQAIYQGQLRSEDGIMDFIASSGLLTAFHEDITPDVAQKGGEEGMQGGQQTNEASYLQLPAKPLLTVPFLKSIEPALESEEGGRLTFFHVLVIRSFDQVHLMHAFASHMLAPDRGALASNKKLSVPPFSSHWAPLVETWSPASGEGTALSQLAACVRAAVRFEPPSADEGISLNRQRLLLLKFLGAAVPAAIQDSSGLSAAHVRELCELAVDKKIDPMYKDAIKSQMSDAAVTQATEAEQAILLAAAAAANPGMQDAATWICNGRRIELDPESPPVSPKHLQALELMEGQYDIGSAGSDAGEEEEEEEDVMGMGGQPPKKKPPTPSTKALFQWLANSPDVPQKAHGLIAAVRSEALSYGKNEIFRQPQKIFEIAPPAFRVQLPPAVPDAACPIRVYGILDPLSTTAQSASAVLALFGMAFNAEVNLVLNPGIRHSEYPLKRYYREIIRWPERLADGRAVSELEGFREFGSGKADLALATQHVLTAAVHALPTWLVTSSEAVHDMDNLRQKDVGDGKLCETTYMLRQLYVEGQAFVLGEDNWPIASAKGLQLDVGPKGTDKNGSFDDTIVMGNLGYFQVHGNPGFYETTLKAGLSNDTFETVKVKDVEVTSYITPPYQLRVKTRPGRSHDDLFEEGKGGSASGGRYKKRGDSVFAGLFEKFSQMMGLDDGESEEGTVAAEEDTKAVARAVDDSLPTIHVFSIASGHLYEKLLGIMMLSVRNHTKCPLHFWFIDNFLSPKFKAFIPQMARRYNFDVSFVTYKWPSWLNPQSEKQRLIWAYKVLFLDVLFPLDVPKVIFIDADQVVRADVRELWDLDLKGRVYGFVPMGDTNPDTEGFRFWKQGYWKNHLNNLPYHISALYVVDLEEYRRTSTGDMLRGVYNQLSRDPGSLSNLEQDLINFAQHQIPIFSLPPEWLWCETWCSQESKLAAKTLDLCQNPLTKEPKIVMAKRIIAEWVMYHDEVERFQDEQEKKSALPQTGSGEGGADGISKPEL